MSGLTLLSEDETLEERLADLYRGKHPVRRLWADTWSNSAEAAAAIVVGVAVGGTNEEKAAVGGDVPVATDGGGQVRAVEEDAWTFRYLVPSLIGASGIAIFGVALGYAVRVRGRYRVTQ